MSLVLLVGLEPEEAGGAEHVLLVGAQGGLGGHGLLAVAVAVDLAEGGGGRVGQLVGGEAHDGAVPLVELQHAVVDGAPELAGHLGDVGAAP